MRRERWLGLLAVTALVGCSDPQHIGTIAWYRTPCEAITAHLCTVMLDEAGAATPFYNPLEGYTPTWGVEADVRYTIEGSSGIPDAVGAYVVDHVDATRVVPAGAPAVWHLSPTWKWFTADGDHVLLLGVPVACASEVCAELVARDDAGVRFEVEVEATGDPATPVRAVAVRAP